MLIAPMRAPALPFGHLTGKKRGARAGAALHVAQTEFGGGRQPPPRCELVKMRAAKREIVAVGVYDAERESFATTRHARCGRGKISVDFLLGGCVIMRKRRG